MKVIAKQKGFFKNRVVMPGETFDAPQDMNASWFEPIEQPQDQPKAAAKTEDAKTGDKPGAKPKAAAKTA